MTSSPLGAADDWPMYGKDPHHTFTSAASRITPQTVPGLAPIWSFPTDDAVSASPTVVAGVVYVGAWDGNFYALDATTGSLVWSFAVDCQSTIRPIPPRCLAPGQTPPERLDTDGGLVTSSALVDHGVVYFAAGKTMYALRARDGALLWKRVVCGRPEAAACAADANDPTAIFSSPVLWDGKLVLGHTADGTDGYRGGILALDARTGRTAWSFEVDPVVDAKGRPIPGAGGLNRGCGSVWSSAAIVEDEHLAVFGVGDCQAQVLGPYAESILALDANTGRLRWSYQPRATDTCDMDFGATANVFERGGEPFVGVGGKDGTYYAIHAESGRLAWSTNVVFGGPAGGFIGSTAFDGRRVYGGTALGDFGGPLCQPDNPRDQPIQDPSFHALDVMDGHIAWETPGSYSFGATTVAHGVVFNGRVGLSADLPPMLRAYDASTGAVLLELPQAGAVNSSATVTSRAVYFGTGNSFDGSGGGIQAYALPR